jgi:hypothetical protein
MFRRAVIPANFIISKKNIIFKFRLILVYDLNNNSTWNIEAHTLALIHAT